MSIREPRELLTNFPRILGHKSYPPTTIRGTPRAAEQAMALIGGETPVHLAQRVLRRTRGQRVSSALPPFNVPGLGSQLPAQFAGRRRLIIGQEEQKPMLPVIERPTPLLDLLKGWKPLIDRDKFIGTLGVLDPQVEKNIPAPYVRPASWGLGRRVAEIPSVTGIIEGPERTVLPQSLNLSVITS